MHKIIQKMAKYTYFMNKPNDYGLLRLLFLYIFKKEIGLNKLLMSESLVDYWYEINNTYRQFEGIPPLNFKPSVSCKTAGATTHGATAKAIGVI